MSPLPLSLGGIPSGEYQTQTGDVVVALDVDVDEQLDTVGQMGVDAVFLVVVDTDRQLAVDVVVDQVVVDKATQDLWRLVNPFLPVVQTKPWHNPLSGKSP